LGKQFTLSASDSFKLGAYRADPAGTPKGGIVVIQEIFGVNSHIRAVADGYAADGYVVIAPAMFDRVQKGFDVGYTPEDIAKGREVRAKVTTDMAMKDTQAAVDEAKKTGKVGIVGYCWGGFVAWMAANKLSGLSAAVPYYGGGILDNAGVTLRCPVQGHFGERDANIPARQVRELAAHHPEVEIEIYLYDADHGFACDERGSYDAPATKLARERTLAFLRRHVG
jgi:carboxymethylenebutenolidase